MKKIRLYIPNLLLTFLLVFFIMGSEAALLAEGVALNPATFQYITYHQGLAQKGYSSLESYFKTRANSTGIPANVYLDVITEQDLADAIVQNCTSAVESLGTKSAMILDFDMTNVEASIRTFFEDYAEENGYEQDEVFEQKVQSTIDEARAELLIVTDPFKIATLEANGLLTKASSIVWYLNSAIPICIAGTALLIVLLILCNRKQMEHLCYWIGLAGFTAGLLMAVPCIYLTASDFFSGFAIKDPQIFSAVVGILKLITNRGLTMAIITMIVGIIGIGGFIFLRAVQREEKEE